MFTSNDERQLQLVLENYVHHWCVNCGDIAPKQTYLCDACWVEATNQHIRIEMLRCVPEIKAN